MKLRLLHLSSALVIGLFLIVHLGNHIYGLQGQQNHIDYMAAARRVYRSGIVEVLLLALIGWQVASGLTMAIRGWKTREGKVAWLQASSGLYLAFFLLNHVGAVLAARMLLGLDTDFRFAAAGFHVPFWPFFFAPYYFLAVFSLFTHVGCALYWYLGDGRARLRRQVLAGCLAIGAILGAAIVMSLAGALYPVDVSPAYRATYGY